LETVRPPEVEIKTLTE